MERFTNKYIREMIETDEVKERKNMGCSVLLIVGILAPIIGLLIMTGSNDSGTQLLGGFILTIGIGAIFIAPLLTLDKGYQNDVKKFFASLTDEQVKVLDDELNRGNVIQYKKFGIILTASFLICFDYKGFLILNYNEIKELSLLTFRHSSLNRYARINVLKEDNKSYVISRFEYYLERKFAYEIMDKIAEKNPNIVVIKK